MSNEWVDTKDWVDANLTGLTSTAYMCDITEMEASISVKPQNVSFAMSGIGNRTIDLNVMVLGAGVLFWLMLLTVAVIAVYVRLECKRG